MTEKKTIIYLYFKTYSQKRTIKRNLLIDFDHIAMINDKGLKINR